MKNLEITQEAAVKAYSEASKNGKLLLENLSRYYKLLLDDIEENKIYITKENYKFVAFDDLMNFLVNNTLYSEKRITEMFKKQSTFKEFREFLNYLAKDYVK